MTAQAPMHQNGAQHEEDCARVLANMRTAVFMVDADLRISLANSAAEQLTSTSVARLTHQHIDDCIRLPDSIRSHLERGTGSGEAILMHEIMSFSSSTGASCWWIARSRMASANTKTGVWSS